MRREAGWLRRFAQSPWFRRRGLFLALAGLWLLAALFPAGLARDLEVGVRTVDVIGHGVMGRSLGPLTPDRPSVFKERVTRDAAGQPFFIDTYRPAGKGPYGAMAIVIGAAQGEGDELLERLATSVAQAGVVAVLPQLPNLPQERLDPADALAIETTFSYLFGLPYVDPARVGVVGFSAGGSLAIVASSSPNLKRPLAFVAAFGAYYDMRQMIASVASETIAVDGAYVPWEPNPDMVKTVKRLVVQNVLGDGPESENLRKLFLEQEEQLTPAVATLSREAAFIYRLFTRPSQSEVQALLKELPPSLKKLLDVADDLSPITHVREIRGPVLLLHDRDDPIVPYTQSRRMAAELEKVGTEVHLTEVSLFRHVRPGGSVFSPGRIPDLARLYGFVHGLLDRLD